MAEIVSLVLAVAGTLDVAARTSSIVARLMRDWKEAPAQIALLSEEIKVQRYMMLQLKEFCESPSASSRNAFQVTVINSLLQRADSLWLELERIVEILDKRADRERKMKWIGNAHKVASLREKLRELRLAMLEMLSISTA